MKYNSARKGCNRLEFQKVKQEVSMTPVAGSRWRFAQSKTETESYPWAPPSFTAADPLTSMKINRENFSPREIWGLLLYFKTLMRHLAKIKMSNSGFCVDLFNSAAIYSLEEDKTASRNADSRDTPCPRIFHLFKPPSSPELLPFLDYQFCWLEKLQKLIWCHITQTSL